MSKQETIYKWKVYVDDVNKYILNGLCTTVYPAKKWVGGAVKESEIPKIKEAFPGKVIHFIDFDFYFSNLDEYHKFNDH
jgi:hypothetical protein